MAGFDSKRVVARTIAPAFTLHQIGKLSLKRAQSGERLSNLDLVTALLMCPLAMEAVLNQIGARAFTADEDAGTPGTWDAVERLAPREKLDAIARRYELQLEFGRRPFQDFAAMFRFRTALVHAKTTHVLASEVPEKHFDDDGYLIDVPGSLLDRWEADCNIETAKRWRDSVYKMSSILAEAAGSFDPVRVGDATDYWSTLRR